MSRAARGSFTFEKNIGIKAYAAVVGKKEGEGPLRECFDRIYEDNLLGEDSWEKAESRMQQDAVDLCIEKCGQAPEDFDAIFSGDLLNQCIASTFGIRSLGIPDIGMYGACSTMSSTIFSAAVMLEAGCAQRCVALTSSHFSSSERQYRNPVQYGGQRPPTAQWTVTGSGAIAIESYNDETNKQQPQASGTESDSPLSLETCSEKNERMHNVKGVKSKSISLERSSNKADSNSYKESSAKSASDAQQTNRKILITAATIGIIQDLGIKDVNNMGAAMAPVDVKLTP